MRADRVMCEAGQPDSWRKRKVEVSVGQKMPNVFTKAILVCQTFVNVKFNGGLKFAEQSKFEGLTLFQDVNQKRVDTV